VLSHAFDFFAPTRLDEALLLLEQKADNDVKILAGGMSLMPVMNLGLARPGALVSLNHIAELAYVRLADDGLHIGGTTRHEQLASEPLVARYCPPLAIAAGLIGDVQVRHRGTIGGSLAHADSSADYVTVMIAVGATFTLASSQGTRRIPARTFFIGMMETQLRPDEVIVEIVAPKLSQAGSSAYLRLARLEGAFSIVNAAAVFEGKDGFVAVGGATPVPVSFNLPVSPGHEEQAAEEAESSAVRLCGTPGAGEAAYRVSMAGVYARRAVMAALQDRRSKL
jgi:aerobic carbon-monoxide dehydrogenase medium subunit